MNNKTILRKYTKDLRKKLNMKDISQKIVDIIRETDAYKSANNVMIFYPLTNEVDLLPLLSDNKNFYLPRVNGDNLDVCPYKDGDELAESTFKVKEPTCAPIDKSNLDLVFVPALSADEKGNRLGYGGGYYDRFLNRLSAVKIVVLPEELLSDAVPVDDSDVKCDGIITQKKASF